MGLWLSAMNVQYRDVRYVVPFLTTFWQYADAHRLFQFADPGEMARLYGLNPMTGVVEGFRWALLGKWGCRRANVGVGCYHLCAAYQRVGYFKRMEVGFADVI